MKFAVALGVFTLWWGLFSHADGAEADLVMLTDAPKQGAMCLDGTAPGYYFRKGSGNGTKKFIIHLEGGGWCYDEDNCVERSKTSLGSSKDWPKTNTFQGLLSDVQADNPDFYDWNIAFVNYCDGASFAGNVDKVVNWKGTTLYFRGFKILQATLDSLMKAGMSSATDVILTGCSAGGLATYLHAQYVYDQLPSQAKQGYHAIADAGYFIDAPNIHGDMVIREHYTYVFKMQNCSGGVNQDCIKANPTEEWKCFFAQYTEPHIKPPFFGYNSQYDTWQLGNILELPCTPPKCTEDLMKSFEKFGLEFKSASADFVARDGRGIFFDSCLTHCQSLSSRSWNSIKVDGQSARETFGDWVYGRSGKSKDVDCAYPCNKSC